MTESTKVNLTYSQIETKITIAIDNIESESEKKTEKRKHHKFKQHPNDRANRKGSFEMVEGCESEVSLLEKHFKILSQFSFGFSIFLFCSHLKSHSQQTDLVDTKSLRGVGLHPVTFVNLI